MKGFVAAGVVAFLALSAPVSAQCAKVTSRTTNSVLVSCIRELERRVDSLESQKTNGRLTPDIELRLRNLEAWHADVSALGRPADTLPRASDALDQRPRRSIPAPGGLGTGTYGGDLIVDRLCVGGPCVEDAGEQIQIAAQGGAGILMRSNMDGQQSQNAATHWGTWSLSNDGGMRLLQNQRWRADGTRIPFIDPTRPLGAVGFDSQGEWSWNGQKVGQPDLGTQRLVIRTDEGTRTVYFATWAEGWKVAIRSSADGCKWCENLRWSVPYQ